MNQVAVLAVAEMKKLGAAEISGVVGPHICGKCYEVGEDIFTEVRLDLSCQGRTCT